MARTSKRVLGAETGQVWEGSDGWVILITEAGTELGGDRGEYVVHTIQSLALPRGYDAVPHTTLTENLYQGGMRRCGWKRVT